jgi:hypothetical protein
MSGKTTSRSFFRIFQPKFETCGFSGITWKLKGFLNQKDGDNQYVLHLYFFYRHTSIIRSGRVKVTSNLLEGRQNMK